MARRRRKHRKHSKKSTTRRSSHKRSMPRRRRRNPSGGFGLKEGAIALVAGAGALFLGLKIQEQMPASITSDPNTTAAVNVAAALGGFLALRKFSAPAALGVAAGLGGTALYAAVAPKLMASPVASSGSPPPAGAVELAMRGVQLPMGAVEVPYGAVERDDYAPVYPPR